MRSETLTLHQRPSEKRVVLAESQTVGKIKIKKSNGTIRFPTDSTSPYKQYK